MRSICLSAKSGDDLSWKQEHELAQTAQSAGEKILWFIDLGIDPVSCSLTDEAIFAQRALALTAFSTFLKPFSDCTDGVILAKSSLFRKWNARDEHEETFHALEEPFRTQLAAMILFADYLHRLASFLPDDIKVIVSIDTSDAKCADKEILLSKERFRHIIIQEPIASEEKEVKVGCVLPEDGSCDFSTRVGLEKMFDWLDRQYLAFRCIPEALLNEEWLDLETLVFYRPAMTRLGNRMAQGFIAAGGKVVYYEEDHSITECNA